MSFIDTHCHFDFPPFSEDARQALGRARLAGVSDIIIPSVSADRIDGIAELSQQYRGLWFAVGLHPLWINEHQPQDIDRLQQWLAQPAQQLVAIGETGLDLYTPSGVASSERQQSLLQQQLQLARRYDLPLILHSRRSHDLLASMLRKASVPASGVIHGFSGSLQQAQAFVRLGYFIGIGGTITYPRARKTRDTVAALPLSSLVLETDAPDMPLNGFQGQPNRPEQVVQVCNALAELRSEPFELICQTLLANSLRLFPRLRLSV